MNLDDDISAAQESIAEDGEQVTWRKTNNVADVAQPWKSTQGQSQDYLTFVVFLKPANSLANAIAHLIQGTDVVTGAPRGLLAGGLEFVPEMTDQVIRDGSVLVIKSINPVPPCATPAYYEIEFA